MYWHPNSSNTHLPVVVKRVLAAEFPEYSSTMINIAVESANYKEENARRIIKNMQESKQQRYVALFVDIGCIWVCYVPTFNCSVLSTLVASFNLFMSFHLLSMCNLVYSIIMLHIFRTRAKSPETSKASTPATVSEQEKTRRKTCCSCAVIARVFICLYKLQLQLQTCS